MADYGEIPGNGSPTADDIKMAKESGWVIPGKLNEAGKSLLSMLGYDPNAKKTVRRNKNDEDNINISSGEIFLNEDQVVEAENLGIDLREFSPGSPHNEGYSPHSGIYKKGGRTKKKRSGYPSLFDQNNNLNSTSDNNAYTF